MDVTKVTDEIKNPALKLLAKEILETVDKVKSGTKDYKQGMVELQGYKQVIQIMALEVMRRRIQ